MCGAAAGSNEVLYSSNCLRKTLLGMRYSKRIKNEQTSNCNQQKVLFLLVQKIFLKKETDNLLHSQMTYDSENTKTFQETEQGYTYYKMIKYNKNIIK